MKTFERSWIGAFMIASYLMIACVACVIGMLLVPSGCDNVVTLLPTRAATAITVSTPPHTPAPVPAVYLPVPTNTPALVGGVVEPSAEACFCFGDSNYCADFQSYTEAPWCFVRCVFTIDGVVHVLDSDSYGTACELLP